MTNGQAKILVIGDVVGAGGTGFIEEKLWGLRKFYGIDMTIVNGENAAVGNGIDKATADRLMKSGVDVITSGNHIWKKNGIADLLDGNQYILRPANYPPSCPGSGYCIFDMCSYKVLIVNLLGTVFMESLESPFTAIDKILSREKGNFDFAVVDIHAEATSEKLALAKYIDGKVSVVFGTHTHVQTADEQILPLGTGYITDVGMCGPEDSVLGIKNDIIIKKFLTKMPVRHEEADTPSSLCGCIFTLSLDSGKCTGVQRICIR